mgnify:CR=1 FL=1
MRSRQFRNVRDKIRPRDDEPQDPMSSGHESARLMFKTLVATMSEAIYIYPGYLALRGLMSALELRINNPVNT